MENAVFYAALAFATFIIPSGRMLEFAKWHCQRGLKASLSIGLGIVAIRAVFFSVGLGVALALIQTMPDSRALGAVAACLFLLLFAARKIFALRHPSPLAGNDNLPAKTLPSCIWYGMRFETHLLPEILLATATAIFFVPKDWPGPETLELLALGHFAASLLALTIYALFARVLLARINRRLNNSRQQRIAKLLSSGLPSVSARYRQNAA